MSHLTLNTHTANKLSNWIRSNRFERPKNISRKRWQMMKHGEARYMMGHELSELADCCSYSVMKVLADAEIDPGYLAYLVDFPLSEVNIRG